MSDVLEILKFIWAKGLGGALLLIIILLVQKPDRAEKLKEIFFLPFFRMFKRGSRQYMAAKVGNTSTQFFKKEVLPLLPSMDNVKIQVQWVRSSSDPILKENGNLIVCMRETNDQTRNILAATQAALPRVVCPAVRPCVNDDLENAVDLALLRKLTDSLGKHAIPVFHRYFLGSHTAENDNLCCLFRQLVELDVHGTFVSIFLEELDAFGERLHAIGDTRDYTDEVLQLLEFLLTEARREAHEEIPLDFFSKQFSIGIIILAVSSKVFREGVTPYVNRINQKVRQACDTIYVIAYEKATGFLDRLIQVIDGDERFAQINIASPRVHNPISRKREQWKIAQLRRSPLFSMSEFRDRVEANALVAGKEVIGQVLDVSELQAFVDVAGLHAVIRKDDCGWYNVKDCNQVLSKDERRRFILNEVDTRHGRLALSLRFPEEDPWKVSVVPNPNQLIQVTVRDCDTNCYYCYSATHLEVILPRHEISWTDHIRTDDTSLIGQELTLKITEKNEEQRKLIGSLRQLEDDPWPLIHKKLPKGTKLRGRVSEVTKDFVLVELPDGLEGRLPSSCLVDAGYELADYLTTVVPGQGMDVIVTKVFIARQRIRLDLLRNVEEE
jgi:predicted RNA-binding protein with RPS1 domain